MPKELKTTTTRPKPKQATRTAPNASFVRPLARLAQRISARPLAALLVAAIAATAVVVSWLVWSANQDHGKQNLNQITAQVGRLIVLPSGETPTLATITDRGKLQQNSFLYYKGQNGDKVLIYTKAGRAILYRPSLHKVVDIGPVVIDQSHSEAKGTTILIEDSTDRPGVAEKIQEKIQGSYPESKVSIGGPTNRKKFPGTIVIDNTEQKDNLVDGLNGLLGVQRGVLPLTETKPVANLLIIIGEDYQ